MKAFIAAIDTEILKVLRSRIFPVSIWFFLFIGIMMGLLMYVSRHPEIAGRSSTISAKTSFLEGNDWPAFFDLMIQMVLTIGVIGSGIVTGWMFGREFSDRVVKDLLALPVHRSLIVLSKLVLLQAWAILLSLAMLASAMLTGLLTGLEGWDTSLFRSFLADYLVCTLLNALLITPVAFIASAGRGYLLPISFVILIMIFTQILFVGLPAATPWFPWALPALFSGVAGESLPAPGLLSYLIYSVTVIAGLAGTIAWWRYADHK